MAALIGHGAVHRVAARLATAALLIGILLGPSAARPASASDPTTGPDGAAGGPTCSERYPAEGPAGLDLRLGCIIGELVGHYTGAEGEAATPASTYALASLALVVGGGIAVWLAVRTARRAAGRRMAPVRPDAWWLCGTCRSVNAAGVEHCYSCGAPPSDGPTLLTDEAPSTTQSFGSSRKRG